MLFSLFKTGIGNVNTLFAGHYVDVRVFYTLRFNEVPCISFISEIDTSKAFQYVKNFYPDKITGIYQHDYFDHDKEDFFFNNTVFVLKDKRMIELAGNFCHVLHTNRQYGWAHGVMKNLAGFRVAAGAACENKTKVIGFARSNDMN